MLKKFPETLQNSRSLQRRPEVVSENCNVVVERVTANFILVGTFPCMSMTWKFAVHCANLPSAGKLQKRSNICHDQFYRFGGKSAVASNKASHAASKSLLFSFVLDTFQAISVIFLTVQAHEEEYQTSGFVG